MFALKALFSDDNAYRIALDKLRADFTQLQPEHPAFAAVIQRLLAQTPAPETAQFSEQTVLAWSYVGFDEQDSAMAEAALLDAGALEVIQE